ncbi:hypothetical protein Tco_1338012 [Tanacetum coccineum]
MACLVEGIVASSGGLLRVSMTRARGKEIWLCDVILRCCLVRRITCSPWSSLIPLSCRSFDVIVGMDWLSKRKFGIICHGRVVRIPLEGDEILRVHGERTQGVVKTLMNTKVGESKLSDLVPGATLVAKSPYRLAPLEMQELSEQLQELQNEVQLKLELELLRKEKLYAKLSVKDKISATSSETSKVENAPAEMLCDLDQQKVKRVDGGYTLWIKLYSKYEYEIRYHPVMGSEVSLVFCIGFCLEFVMNEVSECLPLMPKDHVCLQVVLA